MQCGKVEEGFGATGKFGFDKKEGKWIAVCIDASQVAAQKICAFGARRDWCGVWWVVWHRDCDLVERHKGATKMNCSGGVSPIFSCHGRTVESARLLLTVVNRRSVQS